MTSTTSVLACCTLRGAFETEMANVLTGNGEATALHMWPASRVATELLGYVDSEKLPELPDDEDEGTQQIAETATDRERRLYLVQRRNGLSRPQMSALRAFMDRNARLMPSGSPALQRATDLGIQPRTI